MRIANRSLGIGMIEVLVTLFVLSVGILAGAAMQMKSLKNTQESLFRSQAVNLVNTIVESMRANPEAVVLGYYDNISTTNVFNSTGCLTTGCSPENIATEDIIQWQSLLAPANGSIPVLPPMNNDEPAEATISGNTDGVRTVTVHWQVAIDGDVKDKTYSLDVRL